MAKYPNPKPIPQIPRENRKEWRHWSRALRPFFVVGSSVQVFVWIEVMPGCSTLICRAAALVHMENVLLAVVEATQMYIYRCRSMRKLSSATTNHSRSSKTQLLLVYYYKYACNFTVWFTETGRVAIQSTERRGLFCSSWAFKYLAYKQYGLLKKYWRRKATKVSPHAGGDIGCGDLTQVCFEI